MYSIVFYNKLRHWDYQCEVQQHTAGQKFGSMILSECHSGSLLLIAESVFHARGQSGMHHVFIWIPPYEVPSVSLGFLSCISAE